jgi:hypothetical protein
MTAGRAVCAPRSTDRHPALAVADRNTGRMSRKQSSRHARRPVLEGTSRSILSNRVEQAPRTHGPPQPNSRPASGSIVCPGRRPSGSHDDQPGDSTRPFSTRDTSRSRRSRRDGRAGDGRIVTRRQPRAFLFSETRAGTRSVPPKDESGLTGSACVASLLFLDFG